ncbi:MAG: hypothetical protein U0559_01815 [Anaerolineae bacterium]
MGWLAFGVGIALAQDSSPPSPRTRDTAAPEAFVTIYVDRNDDTNVTACTAATTIVTPRAINSELHPANIYTIYFSP